MSRSATLSLLARAAGAALLLFAASVRAEPAPPRTEGTPVEAEAANSANRAEEPAPPRFERVRTYRFGAAGGAAVGQGYTLSALIATGALVICAASSHCDMKPSSRAFAELYIPLAGPWLALRREDVHGDAKYAILFGGLGAIQAAGVLLIAYDLVLPHYRLEQVSGLRIGAVANASSGLLLLDGRF